MQKTVDLPNIHQHWYMTWAISTQAAAKFWVTLQDDSEPKYIDNKSRQSTEWGILDQGFSRVNGTGLRLTIDSDSGFDVIVIKESFGLIDNCKEKVSGYNIMVEDYTDSDYNDLAATITAWRSKG